MASSQQKKSFPFEASPKKPKKPTVVKPPVETTTGQAGQAGRAVQAVAVPSVDVPPVEMEDPAGEVSELQDLWLQLQEVGLGFSLGVSFSETTVLCVFFCFFINMKTEYLIMLIHR